MSPFGIELAKDLASRRLLAAGVVPVAEGSPGMLIRVG